MSSKIYKTFKDALEEARKYGHSLVRNGDGWEIKLTNTKAPQDSNSNDEVVEINCSKCKKSIRTLKKFINSNEKILCGDCLSKTKEFKEKYIQPVQIKDIDKSFPKINDTAGIMRALSNFKLPEYPAHKAVDDAFKRVKENRKEKELIKSKKIQNELAEIKKTQKRSPRILLNGETSISEIEVKDVRFCIECGLTIPKERIAASNASRCIKCQQEFEKTHDIRIKIDEGLPGTRDGNKKMRGQVWGEINKRNKGN